jgi:predicted nucleic acid-binding protein
MVSSPFVIDSNVFVSLYYEGDKKHTDAVAIFKELNDKILIVHPYVIQETVTVLSYKLGLVVARGFLEDITDILHVSIPVVDIMCDIENFKRVDKKISFTDVALVNMAKRMNAHLVTFDEQMLSLFRSL